MVNMKRQCFVITHTSNILKNTSENQSNILVLLMLKYRIKNFLLKADLITSFITFTDCSFNSNKHTLQVDKEREPPG
jgi:hypothetical protein